MMITTNEDALITSTGFIQRTVEARKLCKNAIVELGYVQLDCDCPAQVIEIVKILEVTEKRLADLAIEQQ